MRVSSKEAMIKKLSSSVISKIAAGEVVETPGSCVRELIENSIDGMGNDITIEIKNAGLELIRVSDNGTGMSKEDIPIAVKRYATSKIKALEDLSNQFSLGFRGEALYAISHAGKVRIISGQNESAWEAVFDDDRLVSIVPHSRYKGTIVEVSDLFHNMPVRRKFVLSSKKKMEREIAGIVRQYAIAHPSVSIKLVINEKDALNERAVNSEAERLVDLQGPDFLREMLSFSVEREGLSVYGFVRKPQYIKGRSRTQLSFVNRRPVDLKFVHVAVKVAYAQENVYPDYIVFIDAEPALFDFNIHPQKKEVKFYDEKALFSLIVEGVKRALLSERKDIFATQKPASFGVVKEAQFREYKGFEGRSGRQLEFGELPIGEKDEKRDFAYTPQRIFQIHDAYIMAEIESGIIFVDQHAAHERIIYEKLKKKNVHKKGLLFPIVVEMNYREWELFKDSHALLSSFGFEIRELSGKSVVIDAVPDVFESMDKDVFLSILDEMDENAYLPDKYQYFLKTIACKAAIKAGQKLSSEAMSNLLDELFACDVPFFCPHGRPLVFKISMEELEKKFGRR